MTGGANKNTCERRGEERISHYNKLISDTWQFEHKNALMHSCSLGPTSHFFRLHCKTCFIVQTKCKLKQNKDSVLPVKEFLNMSFSSSTPMSWKRVCGRQQERILLHKCDVRAQFHLFVCLLVVIAVLRSCF